VCKTVDVRFRRAEKFCVEGSLNELLSKVIVTIHWPRYKRLKASVDGRLDSDSSSSFPLESLELDELDFSSESLI
jgi:hypothetical protein